MRIGGGRHGTAALVMVAALVLVSAIAPAAASATTIPLTGSVQWDPDNYTVDGSPHCAEKWMLLINVPSNVTSYKASVNQPGVETFSFSGPPFTNPITGFGPPYTVPAGEAGWFLGGDSGPGTCTNDPDKYDDITATGTVGAMATISGTIVTPFGDGLGGVTVELSGSGGGSATTASDGTYSFTVQPGTYEVTPQPQSPGAPYEFTPTSCGGGATGVGSCDSISVSAGQNQTENLTGGYTLSGSVLGFDEKPVAGVSVLIQDTEQGQLKTVTATTDSNGNFSQLVAPGSAVATAQALNGTNFYPDPTAPDCTPSNQSCDVDMHQDRKIAFYACVIPNPDGSPLPANTPDPIPGAQIIPPLEAVGCWHHASGDSGPLISDKPIRLDGIDVNPALGTTFTLGAGPSVTSDGPAQMLIGGLPITLMWPITLTYQGAANAAGGSGVSVNDLGAGTGPLSPNVFGLPIALGTGGPLGYGLPFVESTGQTAINLGAQFALPSDTKATWNWVEGKFEDLAEKSVPSIGLSGTITATDRNGLVGQGCGSINDWEPFDGKLGELSGLTICYTPSQKLWTGNAMWQTPSAIARVVGDVYVTVALQNVVSSSTGQLTGYKLQSFQIQADHLDTVETGDGEFRISGYPLGANFFLQSIGGGWKNNLSSDLLQSFNGTFGISWGPEINVTGNEISLIRLDGSGSISPPQNPGDDWVYQIAGAGTLGRLTPFELQLLNLAVSYQFNPSVPIADDTSAVGSFTAHLGGSLPVIGGINLNIAGTSDVPHGTIIDGTQSVKLFGASGTNEVLINNTILVDCLTLSNGYQSGFRVDFSGATAPSPSCNLSGLTRPKLPPYATGSIARSSGRAPVKLQLPAGLRGVMLQVRGTRAAPRFRISGPGVAALMAPGSKPDFTRHALFFPDVTGNLSYVSLDSPRPGTYTIAPLPGSSPIKSVMESVPLPRPKLTAKVERAGCSDRLDYRLQSAGTKVLLLTREGTRQDLISSPHSGRGKLSIPLSAATGRGRLIAYYLRGTSPAGTAVVATFKNGGSNGSERPGKPRLRRLTLVWAPACEAYSYQVTIQQGTKRTTTTTRTPRIALTGLSRGTATVVITALTVDDRPEGSSRTQIKVGG